jgi:hypothetical protein
MDHRLSKLAGGPPLSMSTSVTPKASQHHARVSIVEHDAEASSSMSRRPTRFSLGHRPSTSQKSDANGSRRMSTSAEHRPAVPELPLKPSEVALATETYGVFSAAYGVITTRELHEMLVELIGFVPDQAVRGFLRGLPGEKGGGATIPEATMLTVLARAKAAHVQRRQTAVESLVCTYRTDARSVLSQRQVLFAAIANADNVASRKDISTAIRGAGLTVDIDGILDEVTSTSANGSFAGSWPSIDGATAPPQPVVAVDRAINFDEFCMIMDRIECLSTGAMPADVNFAAVTPQDSEDLGSGLLFVCEDIMEDDDDSFRHVDDILRGSPKSAAAPTTASRLQVRQASLSMEERARRQVDEKARRQRAAHRIVGADGLTAAERRTQRKSFLQTRDLTTMFGTTALYRRSSTMPVDDETMRCFDGLATEDEQDGNERREAHRRRVLTEQRRASVAQSGSFVLKQKVLSSMQLGSLVLPALSQTPEPTRGSWLFNQNSFAPTSQFGSIAGRGGGGGQSSAGASLRHGKPGDTRSGMQSVRFDLPMVQEQLSESGSDVGDPSSTAAARRLSTTQGGSYVFRTRNVRTETPMVTTMNIQPADLSGRARQHGTQVVSTPSAVTVANHDRGTVRILRMPRMRRLPGDGGGGASAGSEASDRLFPGAGYGWAVNFAAFKER